MTTHDHSPSRRDFLSGVLAVGGLAAASPLLAACAGSDTGTKTSGKPRQGGTLTIARSVDVLAVDPAHVSDNAAIWMVSNLYERLYRSSLDGGTEPWLATGHKLSADKLTWTFTLRSGVKFSDGSPLRAADVKFTIERTSKSEDTSYINDAIASVAAPDDRTVVVKTKHYADLRSVLAFYGNGVLPKDLGGVDAKSFFKKPVGTGPFHMTSWQVGRRIVLERNKHYWREQRPYLDKVVLTTVGNDSTRTLQLQGGQADVIESPAWSQIASLKKQRDIAVKDFDSTIVYFLLLNTRVRQLSDANVRQAISLAVNRAAIDKVALFGNAEPAGSMFAPKWPAHDASLTAPTRDAAAAKAAMARSKFPDGFSIRYYIDGGDAVQSSVAQVIQTNLKPLGIDVKISQYDPNTLWELIDAGKYDIVHRKLSLDIPDSTANVPYVVDPAAGGFAKYAGYNNTALISQSRKAATLSDTAQQAADYKQLQRTLSRDLPYVPLYYLPWSYAMSGRVQGFTVPPTGEYQLEKVWLSN